MKIIVGLGNPGKRYDDTPHNAGFAVVDQLAYEGQSIWESNDCLALVATVWLSGVSLLLAKPQTYVNLSSRSVSLLLSEYRVPIDDMVVVCDDLALPLGHIRIKARGGDGGHNGLKSIVETLVTQEFTRVRLGTAPRHEVVDTAEYVISPIPKESVELFDQMIIRGKEAVECICLAGVTTAMNRFN